MRRMEIRPAWVFSNEAGEEVDHRLFDLLDAVHETGKLTAAAKRAEMSYRHAWNTIANWSEFFGSQLVLLERGRGATFRRSGRSWCGRGACASAAAPQLENIASELNLEINRALAEHNPTLRIHASYGYAVAELPELLRRHTASASICNTSLPRTHWPRSPAAPATSPAFTFLRASAVHARCRAIGSWLHPDEQCLIFLVRRQQGIFVRPRNPKRIASLEDLARPDVRFINRQRGSGTRLARRSRRGGPRSAAHQRLRQRGIHPCGRGGVCGERHGGCGTRREAAAREFNLDFVPVATERYLLPSAETLAYPSVQELLRLLRGPEFEELTRSLPGYRADRAECVGAHPGVPVARRGQRSADHDSTTSHHEDTKTRRTANRRTANN